MSSPCGVGRYCCAPADELTTAIARSAKGTARQSDLARFRSNPNLVPFPGFSIYPQGMRTLGPGPLVTLIVLVAAVLVTGCGGQRGVTAPPAAGPQAPGAPALLKEKVRKGEVMVDAEYSPQREGPFHLKGRYLVRFAQYAPEAPRMDFGDQTPFVAYLAGTNPRAKKVPLFHRAAAHGQTTLSLNGRYFVEVAFGDFPYVIRFTPAG